MALCNTVEDRSSTAGAVGAIKESHLGKTPQKPLAEAGPAAHGPSSHFLPAGIVLQCDASVHPPRKGR